jgi:hypothetical protein
MQKYESLRAKWDGLLKSLADTDQDFIDSFISMWGRPDSVYRVNLDYLKIIGGQIYSIKMAHPFLPVLDRKRPTLRQLDALHEYVTRYYPVNAHLFFHYLAPHGNTTICGAENFETIRHSKFVSFDPKELEPVLAECVELYAPKSGYIACDRCGEQIPEFRAAWVMQYNEQYPNGRRFHYCSKSCKPL